MRYFLTLPIILFIAIGLSAQDELIEELEFQKEYAPEEINAPYFGIGSGYTGTFLFTNYDDLNAKLSQFGFAKDVLNSYIYLNGFDVFTSIPYLKNFKIGFEYKSGMKSAKFTETLDASSIKRKVDYGLQFGSLNFSYCITPVKNLAINPSIAIGEGNLGFDITATRGEMDWNNYPSDSDFYSHKISHTAGFIFIRPGINIEYSVTPWMMVRTGVNHTISFMNMGLFSENEWKANGDTDIKNIPDGLKADGYSLEIGVYIGLFNIN